MLYKSGNHKQGFTKCIILFFKFMEKYHSDIRMLYHYYRKSHKLMIVIYEQYHSLYW